MYSSRFVISTVLLTFAVGFFATPTHALFSDRKPTFAERHPTIAERKDDRMENTCSKVTARIDERIANYNSGYTPRMNRFTFVKDTVTKIIDNQKAKGHDVTKLTADLTQLTSLINAYATSYSDFITKLTTTKQYACGTSQGQFKTALEDARKAQKVMIDAAHAVEKYYHGTVRPDIVAIRAL